MLVWSVRVEYSVAKEEAYSVNAAVLRGSCCCSQEILIEEWPDDVVQKHAFSLG